MQAQDVTLISPDGGVRIDGTLLGYNGELYRVDTIYGELTVDGAGVRCEGPGCPSLMEFVPEVRLSGSSVLGAGLMPDLIAAFARTRGWRVIAERHDEARIDHILAESDGREAARFAFHLGNSDEGFADLLADEADIALSQREIRRAEATLAETAGLGDMTGPHRSRVLALDAMVIVVSPRNPVREISLANLAKVLSGRIDNWSALGGPDAPITLHLREDGSGLMQSLQDRLLAPAKLTLAAGSRRHDTDEALGAAVAGDLLGLGVASFSSVGPARAIPLTGPCGFALRANRLSVKTEDYPLTAPMFLYLPARRLPKVARDFLRFTRSAAAQDVIRAAGFVDQSPEEVALDRQGNRLANAIQAAGPEVGLGDIQRMITTLRPMARLSISFRFDSGSTRLDAQSRANIRMLARALELGRYDNRRLLFAGFSDGDGAADLNQRIAARRAEAVRAAVLDAAEDADLTRVTLEADAFGEAMPMACDDTGWGRNVNRRVEVWVR